MSGFLQGVQIGSGIVQGSIDNADRSYRERLSEKATKVASTLASEQTTYDRGQDKIKNDREDKRATAYEKEQNALADEHEASAKSIGNGGGKHGLSSKSPTDPLGAALWKSKHDSFEYKKSLNSDMSATPEKVNAADERLNIDNANWDNYMDSLATKEKFTLAKHPAASKSSGLPGLE